MPANAPASYPSGTKAAESLCQQERSSACSRQEVKRKTYRLTWVTYQIHLGDLESIEWMSGERKAFIGTRRYRSFRSVALR